MYGLVYPIQKTPEGYLNVNGARNAYSVQQSNNRRDEYYLDEVFRGTFGLYHKDGSEARNAKLLEIHCPHHPARLVAKSDDTLICLFCQAGK